MKDLLVAMRKKTSVESKVIHRSYVDSLNGLAGLAFLEEKVISC